MRVIQITSSGRSTNAFGNGGRDSRGTPMAIGRVEFQPVVDVGPRDLRMFEVTFKDGARNRFHTHSTDHILIITEGRGIVATRSEEREVGVGDIAYFSADEEHWHGAVPGHDITHFAIIGGTSIQTVTE